jgi:uncharacterized membrane protein
MDWDKEVTKQQIQMTWDYTKAEADIHCRVYLQVFVVFLTTGLSLLIGGFTEPLSSLEPYISVAGLIIIAFSLVLVGKIQGLTSKMLDAFKILMDKLESLKYDEQHNKSPDIGDKNDENEKKPE